jgi:hypothetical protein
MAGIARGKVMPAMKFAEDEGMRMPESIFLQTVTGEYPEDDRAISPSEIDIVLKADPTTTRVVPWAAEPTAQVIHDSFYHDGRPVTMAPRYVLRHILDLYAQKGWKPIVAPELEFYLVEPNIDADYPLKPPIGRSGRPEVGRQSYSIAAVNEFDPLFDDIYAFCEAQEIEIDTLIHEDGAAQMEINLIHGDAMSLADQVFMFKRTAREAAFRHLEFLRLSDHRVLLIIVTPEGDVQNRVLHTERKFSQVELAEATNFLNARLQGRTISEIRADLETHRAQVAQELDILTGRLVEAGLAVSVGEEGARQLIVRGQANLLEDLDAQEDLERIRLLFADLETQKEVIELLSRAETADGVRIFIGSENKLFSLSGSSLIAAPFRDSRQQIIGVVGIIGPTRLNYARIVPMVDFTAKVVSDMMMKREG